MFQIKYDARMLIFGILANKHKFLVSCSRNNIKHGTTYVSFSFFGTESHEPVNQQHFSRVCTLFKRSLRDIDFGNIVFKARTCMIAKIITNTQIIVSELVQKNWFPTLDRYMIFLRFSHKWHHANICSALTHKCFDSVTDGILMGAFAIFSHVFFWFVEEEFGN